MTHLDKLRSEIEAAMKNKKTLTEVELYDYIVAAMKADGQITRSRIIKDLRKENYSISQSRVFKLFDKINAALEKDKIEALKETLSKDEKAKLEKAEKEKAALQRKLAALEKKLKTTTAAKK